MVRRRLLSQQLPDAEWLMLVARPHRKDAFTGKEISQLSLAYEKASVIFNIGSTLSSLASSQNRSSPEGLKRAFHNARCAAGMFNYINDNFLHAPSTDLSREVVKILVALMVAQATEVFVERLTEERKGAGLRARVSTQAAALYGGVIEEVREQVQKGIFDRSWTWYAQVRYDACSCAALQGSRVRCPARAGKA